MFSWLQALEALGEEPRNRDDDEPPAGGLGLSGLPLPSPLNPARSGGTAFAPLLDAQKPVSRMEAPSTPTAPTPPAAPAPARFDAGGFPGAPVAAQAPAAAKDGARAFEPLPAPTFGALPAITPPPPLNFAEPQRVAMAAPTAPPLTPFGTPTASAFDAPQAAAAFPAMTPPPAMPTLPAAPAPLQFAAMTPGGLPGLGAGFAGAQTGTAGTTGTTTGSQTGQQTAQQTGQTGSTTNQGGNTDFNTALAALGLAKPVITGVNNLFNTPSTPTAPPLPPESLLIDPLGGPPAPPPTPTTNPEWFVTPLGGPAPTVNPVDNPGLFIDPLAGPPIDPATASGLGNLPTGLISEPPGASTATPTPTGPSQSLIGQGVTAVLGPEAGASVNQAMPYVGAIIATALGLANGRPPEQALLTALPSLMQSPAVQQFVAQGVTSLAGEAASQVIGQAIPYVGQVISFATALAGGQDAGQAVLNAAIGIAGAALAGPTFGLSVIAAAIAQSALGGAFGPSKDWVNFGKEVNENTRLNLEAANTLVVDIIAATTPEELAQARAKYVGRILYAQYDEHGEPITFTPKDGQYLPNMPGATGTAHEWGKTFNPNALNAALNNLYGTKETALANGVGDPNAALNYLGGILPIIAQGASGTGGNPGALPSLYASMTPAQAGLWLPPILPQPEVPFVAETGWTGSA